MPQLDVRQPLGHDVEERSIQPNCGPDQRDHNPRLARIVRLGNLTTPFAPPAPKEHTSRVCRRLREPRLASRLAPQRLPRGVLHPVDGREVLVTLDLGDFARDGGVGLRGRGGFWVRVVMAMDGL